MPLPVDDDDWRTGAPHHRGRSGAVAGGLTNPDERAAHAWAMADLRARVHAEREWRGWSP